MKKMIHALVIVFILQLIPAAYSDSTTVEWAPYALGQFNVAVPADWETTYNSDISILSYKSISTDRYSDILTAVLSDISFASDEELSDYCAYCLPELDFETTDQMTLTVNDYPIHMFLGKKDGYNAVASFYSVGDSLLFIIHTNDGKRPIELMAFDMNMVEQITLE